jgi:hypothetical protein
MYRSTHNHATKFAPTATTQTGNTVSIPLVPNPYGGNIGPDGVPNIPGMIPLLGGSNGSLGMGHNEFANLIGTGTDNKGHQADEHLYRLQSQHDLFSHCDGQPSETHSLLGSGDENTTLSDLEMDMVSNFLLCCCFSSHSVHPILCRF